MWAFVLIHSLNNKLSMNNFREELRHLRKDSASQAKQILSLRNNLQTCEILQEEQRQKAEIEIDRLQKKLSEERSRRVSAEEDSRAHLEVVLQYIPYPTNFICYQHSYWLVSHWVFSFNLIRNCR